MNDNITKYLQGDAILFHPKVLNDNCISIPDDDCIYYIKHFFSDLDETGEIKMYVYVYKKERPHLEFSIPAKALLDSTCINLTDRDREIKGESSGE